MSISRRDFFKSAAVVGSGVALASGLTACANEGENNAGSGGSSSTSAGVLSSGGCTTFETDVLIVGAGAAGTEAAINAASAGASVIIVDKKAFGHCGDSGLHYSGRMTTSDFEVNGDSVDVHLEDASAVGTYIIDQEFGKEVLQAYKDDKVTLRSENYGNLHWRDPSSGKPYIEASVNRPRLWVGFKLYNMAYRALEMGAKVCDYCTVTKLLTDSNGSVVGATAVNFKTGNFFVFRAKSVILATGGDAGLWGAGTVAAKFGGGVEMLTGDGHALAAPLGVAFRDLEFRALYSNFGVLNPSGISNLACLYSSAQDKYEDSEGNMPLKEAKENGTTTLRMNVVEWYRTQMEGRGTPFGGMYAPIDSHLIGLGTGAIPNIGYSADMWDQLKVTYLNQGNDLSRAEVGPQLTYDYGGIVTNIKAETGVDGLYAAGECAMHCGSGYGSFRMFSSAYVMGKRAAEAAVERSGVLESVEIDWTQVEEEYARVYSFLTADPANPITVHEMKHRIQDSAWKGSGALRSETMCNTALEEYEAEEADLSNVYIRDKSKVCNVEWMEALALANMIKMAKLDTLASLNRTESRGSHLRAEYPEMDYDNWCKNIYLKEVEGEIEVEIKDSIMTDYQPEPGKVDLGGGILSDF